MYSKENKIGGESKNKRKYWNINFLRIKNATDISKYTAKNKNYQLFYSKTDEVEKF